jgi:hypothetical protein
MPAHTRLLDAIRAACYDERNVVRIISDANEVFINEFLAANDLEHLISEVCTNKGWFDEQGQLHIAPADDIPAECPNCPSNLCKGRKVD